MPTFMRVEQQTIGLTVDVSLMRVHLARPVEEGPWPVLIFLFGYLPTGRLDSAVGESSGFMVAGPEVLHHVEPEGDSDRPRCDQSSAEQ